MVAHESWGLGAQFESDIFHHNKKYKEETKMNNHILALENRINLLQNRDPVGNLRIVNKLKRRLRAIQNQ